MKQWLQQVGKAGCGDWFASPQFPGRVGLSVVFPTIFILYLNDLSSEVLSLILSIMSL